MKRIPLALLMGALLLCPLSTASAATKSSSVFTEVPVLKFTTVSKSVKTGVLDAVTLNASAPGFLTLELVDASGRVVLTLADHKEIHSKDSTFDYFAVDTESTLLPLGEYSFRATMTSQFGVSSQEITRAFQIVENPNAATAAEDAAKRKAIAEGRPITTVASVEDAEETAEETPTDTKKNTKSDSKKTTTKSNTKTNTKTAELTYGEGVTLMGDEGLMVGSGVSDTAVQEDSGYWGLTADASDEEIWAALTRTLTAVDVGETESVYLYDSTEKSRQKIGSISGISQGINVVFKREDGWALVEAYRNEDGAFVRGYVPSNKLRTSTPNTTYGIVIDKAKQTLTVYKEGVRLGSCRVSTGMASAQYLNRETPAGEYILVTRRGAAEYGSAGYTRYTIRFNGNYCLSEMPTTKRNGSTYLEIADSLGEKITRGSVCLPSEPSADGGINAEWIWNMSDKNRKVKVLIFDDKPRTSVPVVQK